LAIQGLQREIDAWLHRRRTYDKQKKHQTQLAALEKILTQPLPVLTDQLKSLAYRGTGTTYADCRAVDIRVTWVRRVWEYFREKFDQRDDPSLEPILAAADEVLWSCYAPAFRKLGRPVPSAPLVYFEPLFSARAVPRDEPPPELRSHLLGPFQQQFLKELPIPIVALPPECVAAPWLLVLLAHEAGHHVQYDLGAERALIVDFAARLENAALAAAPSRAQKWANRAQEVFADAFGVACSGAGWLLALAELEYGSNIELLRDDRSAYPSALVRFRLLTLMAQRVQPAFDLAPTLLAATDSLITELKVAADPRNEALLQDLSMSGALVDEAFRDVVPGCTLESLTASRAAADFGAAGSLPSWAKLLTDSEDVAIPAAKDVRSARLLAGSAMLAWSQFSLESDQAFATKAERLCRRLLPAIQSSREPGTRAGATHAGASNFSEQFTRLVLDQSPEASAP
jgi:hypothetical protein